MIPLAGGCSVAILWNSLSVHELSNSSDAYSAYQPTCDHVSGLLTQRDYKSHMF